MNLPHQEPLIFAQEIRHQSNEKVEVLCDFKQLPTLAMFIEAGAQSSSAFNQEQNISMAFVTMVKNVQLLEAIQTERYLFKVTQKAVVDKYRQYDFEAYEEGCFVCIVKGSFTLVIEEK